MKKICAFVLASIFIFATGCSLENSSSSDNSLLQSSYLNNATSESSTSTKSSAKESINKDELVDYLKINEMDFIDLVEYNQDENTLILSVTDDTVGLYVSQFLLVKFSIENDLEYDEVFQTAKEKWSIYKQEILDACTQGQNLLNMKYDGKAKISFKVFSKDGTHCLTVTAGEVMYDYAIEILGSDLFAK